MEIRPIDANALLGEINDLKKSPWYNGENGNYERIVRSDAIGVVIDLCIKQAPTLDYAPVKHGKWEWYEEPYDSRNPDGNYGWRCSCCKQDLAAELTLGIPGMHYAYDVLDDPDNPPTIKRCLFCGARMEEDER